jgi:hypothetical protein
MSIADESGPAQSMSAFGVNTKTAKALGLVVPSGIMSIADDVIE